MRTKKFIFNSITSAIQQLVIAIVGFIIPRIMLQYYGSEINGLVSSINQFITYTRLVEAGLSGAAIYALYKPLAEHDYTGINRIVSAARNFYLQVGYIFLILIMGMSLLYPYFIESDRLNALSIGLLVLILGICGALDFFTLSKYRILLSADQKEFIVSAATISYIVVNTIIIVLLSKLNVNIVTLKAIALLSIIPRSLILMVYVKINYRFIDYKEKPDKKALNKRWDAFYLQILGSTQQGAPVILATIFTSLKIVSIYTIYNMILVGINSLLSIFVSGLAASFGDVIVRDEKQILKKAYKEFELAYYSIITIVYSITFITIMPFIRLYTHGITDMNYDFPFVGFLFVLNGLLYNIKTPQGMLVISAGLFKETRVQSTIQTAIIIILGIILAPRYGLVGILIASCLSNLYRDIDLMFYIPKNITGLHVKHTAINILSMIVQICIIWLPFQYIAFQPTNFYQWSVYAIIIGLYAMIVVVIVRLIFNKGQVIDLINRTKSIFKIKGDSNDKCF